MKVVVTGAGQLAWELQRSCPQGISLHALDRQALDISDANAVARVLQAIQPDALINAAAYTAVDNAESERDQAMAVNAKGPQYLAEQCEILSAYFLHVSTDFVFDGSASRPYAADAAIKPLGVYGESKAAGEQAIAQAMENNWAVVRTAWVYSSHGNNFVRTMLRLMKEKPALNVVGDQVGTPTWARGLAEQCWGAVQQRIEGTYHWTDAGVASWYDFAVAIQRTGLELGLLDKTIPIDSIPTEAYPTPAKRPAYSVLDKSRMIAALGVKPTHWHMQLQSMMKEWVE